MYKLVLSDNLAACILDDRSLYHRLREIVSVTGIAGNPALCQLCEVQWDSDHGKRGQARDAFTAQQWPEGEFFECNAPH